MLVLEAAGRRKSFFVDKKQRERDNFLCFFLGDVYPRATKSASVCVCVCVCVFACVYIKRARVQRNNDARSKQRERFDFGFTDTLNCVFFSLVFLQHLFSLSLSLSLCV